MGSLDKWSYDIFVHIVFEATEKYGGSHGYVINEA